MSGFLQVIRAAAKDALPATDAGRLDEAVSKTGEALAAYGRWIREDVLPRAKAGVGIGPAKFRALVRLREIGLSVEEIHSLGQRYLRSSTRERARIAGEIRRGATAEQAKEIVKWEKEKRWDEARAFTAKVMEESKAFLRERGLATIPSNEELRVIDTPGYIRHVIPFAAYSPPARFEARQLGLYMVTPHPDKPEMLREVGYAHVRNTAVHEGYPGHHLQLTCANLNPSPARTFSFSTETIDGWAHYCEEMMKEGGFSGDPRTRFGQ